MCDRQARAARTRDLHEDAELAVLVVLARDPVGRSTTKSRLAWCFGIPQIPLPPLTETSVLTGRSTTYWPKPERAGKHERQQRAAGRSPAVACRRWRRCTRCTSRSTCPGSSRPSRRAASCSRAGRVHIVGGKQRARPLGVDGEDGHQRLHPERPHRERERDPVHERVAPVLALQAPRASARAPSSLQLGEHHREHVAGGLLAHERRRDGRSRAARRSVWPPGRCSSNHACVRRWLSGRKQMFSLPAKNAKRASVCGGCAA